MTLLSIQAFGALYTAVLFLICAIAVHAFRLARVGYRSMKKKPPEKKAEPAPEKTEPVYYIVERKKKRPKSEYSDPKRIQFK